MRTLERDRTAAPPAAPQRRGVGVALPLATTALAFALALWQRPGIAASDTKIDLHVDPVGFLADVAAAWSPTGDLGHVQGGQYGGYLFPMGPFFALGHLAGLAPWLVQRLWLGSVLALAAWGVVRALDALLGRPRGVAHAAAALLYVLNPYVVVFSARTTGTLLGYAALPWLLLCAHRGLRAPRSWWWPAAFALIVTASGGGVNAAVTAWVLLGPLLLVAYEAWTARAGARAVLAFGWRTLLATALASAWWIAPLLVQSRYGVDFLRFTEQPGTIWATTSVSESLRLMGYWISYLGVGYGGRLRPYFGDGGVLLFTLPVVLAGMLVPGLALAGFAWTRRRAYAPFWLGLALVGLVAMAAGFPDGTPLRRGATFAYNHFAAVRFLRTTYKAGPLVALAVAALGGLGAAEAARRLRPAARAAGAVAAVALVALAAWPLVRGRALDGQLLWDRVPAAWGAAARHVDAVAGSDGRAVVLPGQLYAYYDWGGTVDPILPSLARRPVAVRSAVAYGDLHGVDLLWTLDALVQQRRALPGQLGPLLDLLGARTVVSGADDDRSRSGAVPAADAADVLEQLGPPQRAWGARRARPRAAGTLGPVRVLARVRAWDRPSAVPLVRLEPARPATVVDGGAGTLADLAALSALPPGGFDYAGDLSAPALRQAAAGEVVIGDSNRRRVLVVSRMAQNLGPTLAAAEAPSVDAAVLDPFPARGADAQTVAVYGGIAGVRSPSSPGFSQFPERRPFAALDGEPSTHWQADRALTTDRRWLEVDFRAPRAVDHVDLLPYGDSRGRVTQVEIAGRTFPVHPGWTRLELGLRGVRALRVRIAHVAHPPGPSAGAGGISELRIPGVRATEALRPPVLAERALAGHDLRRTALSYVFERTTGDDPFRRDPWRGPAGAVLVRDRGDAEVGLERAFAPPAARTWTADGWASAAAAAGDPALDRLAGMVGRATFASSARFEGRPGWRASSAFDGSARPWIGSWQPGRVAWLRWTARHPATLRTLRLAPVPGVRRATRVRLRWGAAPRRLDQMSPAVPVSADGAVRLPAPARGRGFRLDVLGAAFPPGTPGIVRQRRAVGIAELTGRGVPRARVPRAGKLAGSCGDLAGTVAGRQLRLRLGGTVADLDAGRPLPVRSCGPLSLPTGPVRLSLPARTLAPYVLRLRSPAPAGGRAAAPPPPGRIVAAGRGGRDAWSGIRLSLRAPARLVLAEGYDAGWRARCDGRSLGPPQVADGFALGWRVPAGCRRAELWFAPDRLVRGGYALSGMAVLAALVLFVRRRRPPPATERPAGPARRIDGVAEPPATEPLATPVPGSGAAAPLPASRAAARALPLALALGFLFAARATPLFLLAAFVVLWRGIGARPLALTAGALLVVVAPGLTLAIPVRDRGGYNTDYPVDRIAVHWVAVAAVALLALALLRALSTATARPGPGPAAAPSAGDRPAPAP